MHLKIHNTDLGVAYLSFYLQVPISTAGRHKLVFSEIYYDQIFSMTTNEDDQFYKLMLAYRIAERVNRIKTEKINSYEILQNNYINDVLVALAGIYFFKDNLTKIATVDDLTEKLKEVKGQSYINSTEKYILNLDQSFDDYILKIISAVQYRLDTKKSGKKDYTGQEWLPTETNNWLKKDGTYREIYEEVIKKLKQ
jgi:hypothetical protein